MLCVLHPDVAIETVSKRLPAFLCLQMVFSPISQMHESLNIWIGVAWVWSPNYSTLVWKKGIKYSLSPLYLWGKKSIIKINFIVLILLAYINYIQYWFCYDVLCVYLTYFDTLLALSLVPSYPHWLVPFLVPLLACLLLVCDNGLLKAASLSPQSGLFTGAWAPHWSETLKLSYCLPSTTNCPYVLKVEGRDLWATFPSILDIERPSCVGLVK